MANRLSYQQALSNGVQKMDVFENGLSWLLPGEEVKAEEEPVGYDSSDGRVNVHIWITNYRLRLEDLSFNVGHYPNIYLLQQSVVDIPLGSISSIKKKGHSNGIRNDETYGIQIKCKDLRTIRFYYEPKSHSRRQTFITLTLYAFPNSNNLPFFANLYKKRFSLDGWNLYNPVGEFKRMGVPNEYWQISEINQSYKFSVTYPSCLCFPRDAIFRGDSFIKSVGEFRSKARIPTLSWHCPLTHATISRSSQPLTGVMSKKSPDDQEFLQLIGRTNPSTNALMIFDARPSINAQANRANGGGFEDGYPNCDFQFLDIPNIHVIRKSLKAVKKACYPFIDRQNFQKLLDETKWLVHLQTILEGARAIAYEVASKRRSVLVHCSDGWDRTSQLTALSMLLLDPFYRTIEGFCILVEKEWCSFGHKFAHRIGHGENKHHDEERAPIFVQFIDCVWQLYNEFTPAFEFNVCFLKTILDELFACRFGTFLYNCEKERSELKVKESTVSLWSLVLENRRAFVNPVFDPNYHSTSSFISVEKLPLVKLWTDYYCRYNPEVILQETKNDSNGIIECTSL